MKKRWWLIDVQVPGQRPRFLGRCYATEADIRKAAGPYCTIQGNHVVIFGRP